MKSLDGGPDTLCSPEELSSFLRLYISAHKISLEDLKNKAVDNINRWPMCNLLPPSVISELYGKIPARSQLQLFVLRVLAYDLADYNVTEKKNWVDLMLQEFDTNATLCFSMLGWLLPRSGRIVEKTHPASHRDCFFHGHTGGKKCVDESVHMGTEAMRVRKG